MAVRSENMKVHLPFGERFEVSSIVSDEEYLGNRVAEGDLHPSMFWPTLARIKRSQLEHAHREIAELLARIQNPT